MSQVNGAGTTNVRQEYSVVDPAPFNGLSYYRLTQVDFDGRSETFDLIAVTYVQDDLRVEIFPNPTVDFVTLRMNGAIPTNAIQLVSSTGQAMPTNWITEDQLDLASLPDGLYFIQVVLQEYRENFRLIKQSK